MGHISFAPLQKQRQKEPLSMAARHYYFCMHMGSPFLYQQQKLVIALKDNFFKRLVVEIVWKYFLSSPSACRTSRASKNWDSFHCCQVSKLFVTLVLLGVVFCLRFDDFFWQNCLRIFWQFFQQIFRQILQMNFSNKFFQRIKFFDNFLTTSFYELFWFFDESFRSIFWQIFWQIFLASFLTNFDFSEKKNWPINL